MVSVEVNRFMGQSDIRVLFDYDPRRAAIVNLVKSVDSSVLVDVLDVS